MQLFNYGTMEGLSIGLKRGDRTIDLSRGLELYQDEDGAFFYYMSLEEIILDDRFKMEFFKKVYNYLELESLIPGLEVEDEIEYEPPLYEPSKILALGRNYAAHAAEGGRKVAEEPIFFSKLLNTLLPHEGEIVYPPHLTRIDHEAELAVVIGETAKDVDASEGMDYVAGYTIANDITARDMQKQDQAKQHPWLRSKNFDTFCPMGPYLVPRDAIHDVHNLDIELKVNGETRQKSNTSKMVFRIPEVISYLSKHMTLFPGDIILTGTPEGISPLKVGDVVEASIEGLGTLRNTVVGG
jgi:5-oxopent-3-ene-1,2,5-tricarboxylate decarboxylase/2-hydroxyhepta-2,4-diene-1,7-dioate isomerase